MNLAWKRWSSSWSHFGQGCLLCRNTRVKFSNFYLLIRWKIKSYFSNNEKFWPFGLHKGHKAKKWNTNFALNYYFPIFSLLCLYYIASGQIHFSKTWKSTQLTTAPSAMSSKQMSSEKWSSISPFLRKFCSVMSTQIKVPEHCSPPIIPNRQKLENVYSVKLIFVKPLIMRIYFT